MHGIIKINIERKRSKDRPLGYATNIYLFVRFNIIEQYKLGIVIDKIKLNAIEIYFLKINNSIHYLNLT